MAVETRTVRMLFANLFLVPPVEIGFGPFRKTVFEPPAHAARRDEFAALLPDGYDVVAAAELFRTEDFRVIDDAWRAADATAQSARGPQQNSRLNPGQASGLATFVRNYPLVGIERLRFSDAGRFRDGADRMAAKGVLLVRLNVAGTLVEVASTHLHAGGWTPGVPVPPGSAEQIRAHQVTELGSFLHRHHDKDASLFVCGDFNIDDGTPADHHLRTVLGTLDLVDAWTASDEGGPGFTSNVDEVPGAFVEDPNDARFCLDAAEGASASTAQLSRIDRWFAPELSIAGDNDPTCDVVVRQVKRRMLSRSSSSPGYEAIATLSDHIALDLELELPS